MHVQKRHALLMSPCNDRCTYVYRCVAASRQLPTQPQRQFVQPSNLPPEQPHALLLASIWSRHHSNYRVQQIDCNLLEEMMLVSGAFRWGGELCLKS